MSRLCTSFHDIRFNKNKEQRTKNKDKRQKTKDKNSKNSLLIITFVIAAGRFVVPVFIAGEESPGNVERHTS